MARPAAARRGGHDANSDADSDRAEESPTFFLLDDPAVAGATVELSPEEARHALRVLRLEPGALVPATDGRGARYRLRLLPRGRRCLAEVLARQLEPPPRPALEIGVGAGRRERFLWCVEKLTELGAARVTPLLTAAVRRPSALLGAGGERYTARALARARAALKQSKGLHLPEMRPPEEVDSWAARSFAGASFLLAFPQPGVPSLARAAADAAAEACRLAVGPEGGFRPEEEAALVRRGFVPAHLGERRLRFETAAVAAACYARAAAEVSGTRPPPAGAGGPGRARGGDPCSS